jgi:hypothetical protein
MKHSASQTTSTPLTGHTKASPAPAAPHAAATRATSLHTRPASASAGPPTPSAARSAASWPAPGAPSGIWYHQVSHHSASHATSTPSRRPRRHEVLTSELHAACMEAAKLCVCGRCRYAAHTSGALPFHVLQVRKPTRHSEGPGKSTCLPLKTAECTIQSLNATRTSHVCTFSTCVCATLPSPRSCAAVLH